jgi:putative phosphoribosyl transferase
MGTGRMVAMSPQFIDRIDAASRLASALEQVLSGRDSTGVVLVGLPRGGVPMAAEIGRRLGFVHDVIVVRKLGVPHHRELAMGAIGEGGIKVVNDDIVSRLGIDRGAVAAIEAEERAELDRRLALFRSGRPAVPLAGQTVVVIDDGLATGASARAACQVARKAGAEAVVLAVPVAPHDWTERLAGVADAFVAIETPVRFRAVGEFYDDFGEVSDADVVAALTSTG